MKRSELADMHDRLRKEYRGGLSKLPFKKKQIDDMVAGFEGGLAALREELIDKGLIKIEPES